jgi:ribosomal protein S18 acetylase RimI-like enzyme
MTDTVTVRAATADDAPALVAVLAEAFMADQVSAWLFPDEQERQALHPLFFQPFVTGVLASGLALTTTDHAGVALWLDVDPAQPADPEESGQLHSYLRGSVGDGPAGRFQVLDELMAARHPRDQAHGYLPFIAVASGHQGRGVGAALLRHRLEQLDAGGVPAYLEASSLRSAALYERLGFQATSETVDLPDGPTLYPMWRPPA